MKLDLDRIEEAVTKAEEGSRGEIVCVLSREVSHYREVPLAWAAAVALAAPPITLALGLRPRTLTSLSGDWTIAHAAALDTQIVVALGAYALTQAILFALVAAFVSIPAVRRVLTPRMLKRRRVRQAADRQYGSIAARAMGSDTGVLLFVAVEDHLVEIIADAAIHAKVGSPLWEAAAKAIRDGMRSTDPSAGVVSAVEMCGAAMRQHFPATGENHNYIANRPVEI